MDTHVVFVQIDHSLVLNYVLGQRRLGSAEGPSCAGGRAAATGPALPETRRCRAWLKKTICSGDAVIPAHLTLMVHTRSKLFIAHA